MLSNKRKSRVVKAVVTLAILACIPAAMFYFFKNNIRIVQLISKGDVNNFDNSPSFTSLPSTMRGIGDDNEARKKRIKDFCATKDTSEDIIDKDNYHDIIVDEKHKTIFCAIPKVATTTLKRILSEMAGMNYTKRTPIHLRSIQAKFGLHGLGTYSKEKIAYRLENYFKFVFVRHPLTRFLSAYRNKIVRYSPLTDKFLSAIQEYYEKNVTAITFNDFAIYVTKLGGLNEHWNTYKKLCKICHISYDFIGRLENFSEEAYNLFKTFESFGNITDKRWNPTNSDLKVSQDYYKQLSEEVKHAVVNYYRDDIDMFGYTEEDLLEM